MSKPAFVHKARSRSMLHWFMDAGWRSGLIVNAFGFGNAPCAEAGVGFASDKSGFAVFVL